MSTAFAWAAKALSRCLVRRWACRNVINPFSTSLFAVKTAC